MKSQHFFIAKRLKSFTYAFNGFKILFKEEHNARIHAAIGILVLILSIYFGLNINEWMAILFSIGLVFSAEFFNSAIENLCDFVSPQWNDKIKKVKDLSAAAVLLCAIIALIIGSVIFVPKIFVIAW
jgi:diacylglycerol kinase